MRISIIVEKRYTDPPEKCAEYLRLALTHMTKQLAGVHPISYAVWYDYVSGANASLNSEIDDLLKDGGKLDEETTQRLYEKYVAELDAESMSRLGDNLKRVMTEVSSSTSHVGSAAGVYGEKLEVIGTRLDREELPLPEFKGIVKDAFMDTVQMRSTVASVQTRLSASQTEIEELRKELARVREESLVDTLTGLLNRRAFDLRIAELVDGAQGNGESFCLIVVDIDHFKRINDSYGHLFGDRVIRAVGSALRAGVKGKDFVGRYGGEEFAILLPATAPEGAWAVAEGVRRLVAGSRIRRLNNDEVVGNITVSAGVACHRATESVQAVFERADEALYRAKHNGRNRVEMAG
ncbi:MAG: diguanylate cyclase [Betaproteobacteria bacterium]|nr:diguanylate cyclase [Betaproteobacteria bacterium]